MTFQVGDLVMFRHRTQICESGMRVQEVDTNMFDTRLKVNDQWWVPENFMPFDEWVRTYRT